MVSAPGQPYYGCVNGARTKAIYIGTRTNRNTNCVFYLLAVPVLEGEAEVENGAKTMKVRDAQAPGPACLCVRVVALVNLNLQQAPRAAKASYRDWPEGAVPRLDDLTGLLNIPEALPMAVTSEGQGVVIMSESEAVMSEAEGDMYGQNMDLGVLFSESPPLAPRAAAPERLPTAADAVGEAVAKALGPLALRLERLEARLEGTDRGPPGPERQVAFAPLSRDLEARFMARRPEQGMAAPRPREPILAPLTRAGQALLPDEPDEFEELELQEPRQVTRPQATGPSLSRAALFRLEGARGRVAQAELDSMFEANPSEVVTSFERQVLRHANVLPGTTSRSGDAAAHLLDVWRRTVPAGDHFLTARVGEAIIDSYRRLRTGDTAGALARMALTLGALEQSVRDGAQWELRAETLLGLPPAQLDAYKKLQAKPNGKKVGTLAQLADPVRTTTANAVYKEEHGSSAA